MKNRKKNFRILVFIMVLAMLPALCACGNGGEQGAAAGGTTKISFKQALSYEYLKSLDGTEVTINGYLATSSPVDGSFVFLMNLPFQSCPFCVPNTSQLSNTMEVYPEEGKTFSYTNQAVKVTGTLEVAESEDEPFTDMYGYEFAFKIADASYTILKDEDMSAELALWQKFASTDLMNEINDMYNYVNFLCSWNEYYVDSYDDGQGNTVPGYYLYASDALNFVQQEGAQYHYGYQEGYFDDIISKIEAIDPEVFGDLVENIRGAKALAEDALQELLDENYTFEEKYVEEFGTTDYVFTITNGAELQERMDTLYLDFSSWLGGWEM